MAPKPYEAGPLNRKPVKYAGPDGGGSIGFGKRAATCKELAKHRKTSGRLTCRAGRTTCDNTQAASFGSVAVSFTIRYLVNKLQIQLRDLVIS